MGVLALISVYSQAVGQEMKEPNALGVVAAIAGSVPLAFRRIQPIAALATTLAVTLVYYGLGYPEGSLPINCLLLTYSVAAWSPPTRAAIGLGLTVATIALLRLMDRPEFETINTLVFFVGAWLAGSAVRWRRESMRAEVRAANERAEIDRQRAARMVAEERLRIAQELHDVVAHSMSVIAVQAGAGSHLLAVDPAQAQASLDAISATSRATLREMRRLLGVLRDDDGGRGHAPAPSVGDLPALVEDVRSVGVPAELRVDGQSDGLNPALELSAFRIVQEALTNVLKHAGPTTAVEVTLDYRPDELHIEVVDDGRGLAAHPARSNGEASGIGHGLVGMRERVEAWGGTISTGQRPGGGYRVDVTLPYGAPR
jgi:signal transduction histidine kinase